MKYLAYVRKSTEGQEKQVLSIESQKSRIREYFKELNVEFLEKEEKSAFHPYNRPIFDQMIDAIQEGKADGIVAWHPDRLSRNEIDAAKISYMIRKGQIKDLKFCSYNFDNSPEGIWMLQMAMSQSQYDSAKKGRDVKRGLQDKIKMGWRPGVAPIGYLNDRTKDRGEREIVSDPDRFPLVRKMFDLMLTGAYTPPKILSIANDKWNFRTVKRRKAGGRPMARSTMYELLSNIFYAGIIEYNGEVSKGKHQPMITLEEFDRVQELLGKKGKPRPKKHDFAFTGLIRCDECGARYTAETKTKYIKSTGETKSYTYYHCTRRRKGVACTQNKSIGKKLLEKQIDDEIGKITILPIFQEWALKALRSSNDKEIKERFALQKTYTEALSALQEDLDNLSRCYYRQELDKDFYLKEKNRIKLELSKLEDRQSGTKERAEKWLELTEKTFDFVTYARVRFESGSVQVKREIFSYLGQDVSAKMERSVFNLTSGLSHSLRTMLSLKLNIVG